MVRAGLVTAEQLHAALLEQQHTGLPLGRILIARGYASSAAVANALADQAGRVLRTEYGVAVGSLPEREQGLRLSVPHGAEPAVTSPPTGEAEPHEAVRAVPTHVPADEHGRHRVRVVSPNRRRAFSDYCRRLGADVEDLEDGWFEVWFAAAVDDDLGAYLASWSATNGVELELRPAEAEAPDEPQQPEAFPARRVSEPLEQQPLLPPPPAEEQPHAPQPPMHRGMRLGELLVSKGFISEHQLEMALLESQTTGTMLGRVLLEKQWLFEDELARCLSEQWNLRFVSLGQLGVDRSAVRLVPKQVGLQFAAIPVRFTLDTLDVAFVDPTDEGALEAIDFFVRPFNPVVATLSDVTRMWRQVAA